MANKLVCHGCSSPFWNKLEFQNRAPEQQNNKIAFVGRLFGNRRPNRTAFCWGRLVQRRCFEINKKKGYKKRKIQVGARWSNSAEVECC